METLFWLAVVFIVYVYAGYPLLLGVWAMAAVRRSGRRELLPSQSPSDPDYPGISIIIAARNEGHRLPDRIDNLLAADYPGPMQIIVASDGSTDDTDEALAPYAGRITLLTLPPSGKAAALNAGVLVATHPILVFADARQRFAPDAIGYLVSHFADPKIGAVSGELLFESDPASSVADSVGVYWSYEKWLRRREAIVGSTLGVTGAIYAMRRSLWQSLPWDTLLDDVLGPMRVVLRGYRVAFDDRAHAHDAMAKDTAAEARRKVRTLAGNFQLLAREPRLLLPIVNPVWLQFMSHKIGRLLVPYALLALLVASAALAGDSLWYALALVVQIAFYALAGYGAFLERRRHSGSVTSSEVIREAA
jgi:cellulose synthase/poly-beta-1,6-N-acetylglucosamine synthase-like glycosyltransferase